VPQQTELLLVAQCLKQLYCCL